MKLVLDATVLSHFARAGRLNTLEQLCEDHTCLTTAQVRQELLAGVARYPELGDTLALSWVDTVELDDLEMIVILARYKLEFGGGLDRNLGEASVLGWVAVSGDIAVIDDEVARQAGLRDGIAVNGSLWLIINGIRNDKVSRPVAETLVDELIETGMRLPTDGRGLFAWAYREGLLP